MKLADIARVDSGYHFRGRIKNDPEGRLGVIQAKDFSDDLRLVPDGIVRVAEGSNPGPYVLWSGDVLFLSRGHRPWAVVVGELPLMCIVPSSFYILRVEPQLIRPGYLAWFLNQPSTQTTLRSIMRGSNIPFISKADLQELSVPLPDLTTQQKIENLDRLAGRERRLLQELAEKRRILTDAVCMELAEEGE